MAESILIGLASDILTNLASDIIEKAYEQGVSIWEAKDDLVKLKEAIQTLQSVVVDAEKKQDDSVSVKDWVKRLKGVLYEAEDLFDEVAADDLLEEFVAEGCLEKQVWIFCSKLNPVVSRYSVAKRIKAIRERLDEIKTSMVDFGFVRNLPIVTNKRGENDLARVSIDAKYVIGRDEDKKAILELLLNESSDTLEVISIEGIGGMGKTTLAKLIHKDEKVIEVFGAHRWIASLPDTTNEKEVLGLIYQSICWGGYGDLGLFQLEEEIKKSITDKKYLLVLDNVWEDDYSRWLARKSILSCGAKGSKIIVTTRLKSVGMAIGAIRAHTLGGLSGADSWNLFKSLAFSPGNENDPTKEKLGKKLLEKCRGVPLAIRCMGSLLRIKTFKEWGEIETIGLPIVGGAYDDEVMQILKLSYDHLPLKHKQCFTYCCLFPKGYRYAKKELIYHWIFHRYINIDEGESSFMYLLRMGFFQEVEEDRFREIESCKMHDIMHDLATHLGGEEIKMIIGTSFNVSSYTRHVSLMVDGEEAGLWNIPMSLLDIKAIRSFMLSGLSPNLDQLCSNFSVLRTLKLSGLGIEHIPSSIGELKLLRYLDLSCNEFKELPDSMAKLVNLLVLDISGCSKFKVWPHNFKKMIRLWSLNPNGCDQLRLMPEGFGGMLNLQYLSLFVVGKGGDLDVLNGLLKQLRDHLWVRFCEEIEGKDGLNWKLPSDVSLQSLDIISYPGYSIRGWEINNCTSKLESLEVRKCKNVKHLSNLSCLPNLKRLVLTELRELEFMEEEEDSYATSTSLFFPCLEVLELVNLPKLKGWRGKVAAEATSTSASSASSFLEFPNLSKLSIEKCSNLKVFDLTDDISSTNFVSYTYPSLHELRISDCWGWEKLHLAFPHLQRMTILECMHLRSIELVGITYETSLRYLVIDNCEELESLHIEEHVIAGLEEMTIEFCPELRLKLSETQGKRLLVQQGLPEVKGCKLRLSVLGSVLPEQLFSLSSIREITINCCKGPMSLRGVAHASLQKCHIINTDGMESLHIPSPHLREVDLYICTGLVSAEFEAPTSITIFNCFKLKNLHIAHPHSLESLKIIYTFEHFSVAGLDWDSIPRWNGNLGECSSILKLYLEGVDCGFIERLLSSSSSTSPSSSKTLQEGEVSTLKNTGSVTVALASLQNLSIERVDGLKILNISSPRLKELTIRGCYELTNVSIVNPTALTQLRLYKCPELQPIVTNVSMDWDSLPNLEHLELTPMPPPEEIPECLLQRQALGHLQITQYKPQFY